MTDEQHLNHEDGPKSEPPYIRLIQWIGDNWGKVTSYGVGTTFAIILLNLVVGIMQRNADDALETSKVQRETSVENANSYKSVAHSMVTVGSSMEKLSQLAESTKNIQKQMMDESREFQKESRVYQNQNLNQQKRILDELVSHSKMLTDSVDIHTRQLDAIEGNRKKLEGLKKDYDERNVNQGKKLDEVLKSLEKRK